MSTQDNLADALREIQVMAADADLRATHHRTALETISRKAREALAEHDAQPALQAQQPAFTNEVIREGKTQWDRVAKILGADGDCVDSVIAAAERLAQQPGAQAVAWHTDDHLTDKSATTYDPVIADRWRAKGWPVTPHYTNPQPPSIPEPSEADVELAWSTLRSTTQPRDSCACDGDMRAVLSGFAARLRERVGQAPGGRRRCVLTGRYCGVRSSGGSSRRSISAGMPCRRASRNFSRMDLCWR